MISNATISINKTKQYAVIFFCNNIKFSLNFLRLKVIRLFTRKVSFFLKITKKQTESVPNTYKVRSIRKINVFRGTKVFVLN